MALKHAHDDKLYLPDLSNTEILILAFEASQKLEWDIDEVTPEGARFEVPFNMYCRGEKRTYLEEEKKKNSFWLFFIPRKGFMTTITQ